MGKFTEKFVEDVIRLAYFELYRTTESLEFPHERVIIPIDQNGRYFRSLPNTTKVFLKNNIDACVYKLKIDKWVQMKDKRIMSVEAKAYSENAMLKRILFDAYIFKSQYPKAECCLFQLESQLGGDYKNPIISKNESCPSHAIMSFLPNIHLHIITLLNGERSIKKPITQHPKKLSLELLNSSIDEFKRIIQIAVQNNFT